MPKLKYLKLWLYHGRAYADCMRSLWELLDSLPDSRAQKGVAHTQGENKLKKA